MKKVFLKPITPVLPYKNFIQQKITIKTIIKNPMHYEQYQRGSGRKAFIESHWGLKMIKKIKAN